MECGETDHRKLWESNLPWLLANMAHLAYFDEATIHELMEPFKAERIAFLEKDGAQAFMVLWDDRAILSFRGSQPLEDHVLPKKRRLGIFRRFRIVCIHKLTLDQKSLLFLNNDVLADLIFKKTRFDHPDDVQVHSGFLGEINKLWGLISPELDAAVGSIPIWVTGHSLGGAMATLAGMRFPFEAVVTFGEPRVGSHIHQVFKAKKHVRYVNGDDPVTRLPPELIFGYDHHGEAVRITDRDGHTDPCHDHSIVYYSENLA